MHWVREPFSDAQAQPGGFGEGTKGEDMPQRKDEYYAGLKENMKWCPVCGKRLIKADLGMCQDCSYKRLDLRQPPMDAPELQRCPECRQKSLFWDSRNKVYECLNRRHKKRFTEHEFEVAEQSAPPLQKCPDCGQETITWVEFYSFYECVNPKCKRCFTETEFKKIAGESKP